MLIVHDQKFTSFVVSSALALGLFGTLGSVARAAQSDSPVTTNAIAAVAAAAQAGPDASATVTIERDGIGYTYATKAHTVGDFLAERELNNQPNEAASYDAGDPIVDGMRIVLRPAPLAVPASHGRHARTVAWFSHITVAIAPSVKHRSDPMLENGKTAIVDAGRPGIRSLTYRFIRRGNAKPVRTLVASRIVRMPRARVIARGVGAYASLARVAEAGFASVAHFAGSAIHMIATAYTAGCYGCSGITASGVRAGFGIIAVDPRVIPLGTKLFIPGYGRAVAGDTGGAILGHRVDLGMNTQRDALQFGRRSVVVYVLR